MQPSPSQIADALHQLSQSDGLRELENRLAAQNAFNLFDAIGVSNQELRHSDFLAFLLRPNEAHGLGDAFLKWFLGHALANSPAPPISQDTINAWDLTDAIIVRELNQVDLFVMSDQNRLSVIVENKIYTGEHSDQLTRYKEDAEAQGHGRLGKTLLCVYLTPRGSEPSHSEYLPISYEGLCTHLEQLCHMGAFENAKSEDVVTVVQHYTRMLRSQKIVGDPEITQLCLQIYEEHKDAINQIIAAQNAKINPKGEQLVIKAIDLIREYFQTCIEIKTAADIEADINEVGEPSIKEALRRLTETDNEGNQIIVKVDLPGRGTAYGYYRFGIDISVLKNPRTGNLLVDDLAKRQAVRKRPRFMQT